MKVEMLPGEDELLREMCGGVIPKATQKLFCLVRAKLLLTGHAYQMPKETLALIAALSGAVGVEPPEQPEPAVQETNGHGDQTPDDELSLAELAALEQESATLDAGATGGEYAGNRIKWQTEFKSTPRTPVAKLERGRPITYVSERSGVRFGAKFIRVLPRNKKMCSVQSSEMKKPMVIPLTSVEITDLSPPSTQPLAIQI